MLGIMLLGQAIVKLDISSTSLAESNNKLARANVWIGLVLAVIAVMQVILMFQGH